MEYHIASDYEDLSRKLINGLEDYSSNVYADIGGVPTICYGYALLVKNKRTGNWLLKSNLVSDLSSIDKQLTNDDRQLLNDVLADLNRGDASAAKERIQEVGFSFSIDKNDADILFGKELERAEEFIESRIDSLTYASMVGSKELAALASLAYNSHSLIGEHLVSALNDGDRAKAWYEIRYNSNGGNSASRGIAKRRYIESSVFGLYDEGDLDENQSLDIYRMYTKNQAEIMAYEQRWGVDEGAIALAQGDGSAIGVTVNKLEDELHNSAQMLFDLYNKDGSLIDVLDIQVADIEGAMLSGHVRDGYQLGVGSAHNDLLIGSNNSDLLAGGGANDVLHGLGGNDLLDGGGGGDRLYGGAGDDILEGGSGENWLFGGEDNDVYILNGTGQSVDHVTDHQGANGLIFNGHLVAGAISSGSNSWISADGRFTYTGDASLTITDNVTDDKIIIDEYQDGDFGVNLVNVPVDPETKRDIVGDFEWQDFDSNQDGIQVHYDDLGNPIQTTQSKVMDDVLSDSAENDHISSGAGNDTITADQGGNDYIQAGDDNDWVNSGVGNDLIEGGAGTDILAGGNDNDRIYADGVVGLQDAINASDETTSTDHDWLSGGNGNDILVGSNGSEGFAGGGGDDLLVGGAGDDNLIADVDWLPTDFNWSYQDISDYRYFSPFVDNTNWDLSGNDRIYAGTGNDYAWGGPGKDVIYGQADDDHLYGQEGNDYISGGTGSDYLYGGGDQYVADVAENGDDYLDGGSGNDKLYGEEGNDVLIGGLGDDELNGGDGDDLYLMSEGGGIDTIEDSDGVDKAFFDGDVSPDNIVITSNGYNTLYVKYGNSGDLVIINNGVINGIDYFSFSNTSTGASLGYSRNDFLEKYLASTVYDYGTVADDDIQGGSAADVFYASNGDDIVHGGGGDDKIYGENGADVLYGDGGSDLLVGGDGADTLIGGSGDDDLQGGMGNDVYRFGIGSGKDTISDDNGDSDAIVLDDGISQADVSLIHTHDGDLKLSIKSADDVMTVKGWYANPLNRVEKIVFSDGSVIDQDSIAGLSFPPIDGTDGDDQLTGWSTDDSIYGYAGDDTLDGAGGDDLLSGGAGEDAYLFGYGTGSDTVVETGLDTSVIQLAPGIEYSQLEAYRVDDDLLFALKNTDTNIRIQDYFNQTSQWLVRSDSDERNIQTIIDGTAQDLPSDVYERELSRYVAESKNDYFTNLVDQGFRQISSDRFELKPVEATVSKSTNTVTTNWLNLTTGQVATTTDSTVGSEYVSGAKYAGGVSDSWLRYENRGFKVVSVQASGTSVAMDLPMYETTNTTQYVGFTPTSSRSYSYEVSSYSGITGVGGGSSLTPPSQGNPGDYWYSTSTTTISTTERTGSVSDPGGSGSELLQRSDEYSDLQFEELVANDEDNIITEQRSNSYANGYGAVDAGAGNDTVNFGGVDSYNGYGSPYSGTDVGKGYLIYGNTGDDELTGSELRDDLIGGEGNDFLDGGLGADSYFVTREGNGVDVINDVGCLAIDAETGYSAYKQWYYDSQNIYNWGIGGLPDASGESDPASFPPELKANDYAALDPLVKAGVIEKDVVEFGEGISLADLDLSWGEIQLNNSSYVTMDISWGTDGEARLVMPHSHLSPGDPFYMDPMFGAPPGEPGYVDPSWWSLESGAGVGIEEFKFSDGTVVSMQEMLQMTPEAPDFDSGSVTVNQAPVLNVAIPDQVADEDQPFEFQIPDNTFADKEPGDVLTFGVSPSDGNNPPQWLRYDADTRTLSGMPGNDDVGEVSLTVQAIDGQGETAETEFTIRVNNVNDAPVLAYPLPDLEVDEDSELTWVLPADAFKDIDAGDTLVYSATLSDGSDLPSWLSFDSSNQTMHGIPGNGDVGAVDIRIYATDQAGATATSDFTLTVDNVNDAPIVANQIDDQSTEAYSKYSWTLPENSFQDVDVGDVLSYDISLSDGSSLPDWLVFDQDSLTLSGTPHQEEVGTLAVSVTATDTSGASAEQMFSLGVTAAKGTQVVDGFLPIGVGGQNGDVLVGDSRDNYLLGLGGNDVIDADSGADWVMAGQGNDIAYGGSGKDLIWGGSGSDILMGEEGNDRLVGGSQNDLLLGGAGNDRLNGSRGSDALIGEGGNDNIAINGESDVVMFNAGDGVDSVNLLNRRGHFTLSIGNGLNPENLVLDRNDNDLVLGFDSGAANSSQTSSSIDSVVLKSWYRGNRNSYQGAEITLQVVEQAYSSTGTAAQSNGYAHIIERYDFQRIVAEFDSSGQNHWSAMDSLLDAHLGESGTDAIGGDIAYRYGMGMSIQALDQTQVATIIKNPKFGKEAQEISPITT